MDVTSNYSETIKNDKCISPVASIYLVRVGGDAKICDHHKKELCSPMQIAILARWAIFMRNFMEFE